MIAGGTSRACDLPSTPLAVARPVGPRNTIVFAIGAVMMALGTYVGAHPFFTHGATVTESRLLALMLTLFFLLRGWMNVRTSTGRPVFGGGRGGAGPE